MYPSTVEAAGDRITASIELRRHLGAGGMGHVWIAWHSGLHAEVVVKMITEGLAADPTMVARFSREAAAAAAVRSPHVVQIFDHGVTASGQPYIAMEKLEGESLRERLDRTGSVRAAELVTIVGQCARALARAHESGVVHRDIKPDNIFLTDLGAGEPFVKVLDFGIAKADVGPTGATTTGVLGSPFYMSPEQILGHKEIDLRTDVWSLGVLTYEALLGVRPFLGETVGALSIAICREPLPTPSHVRAGVPAAFDEWFARACARELAQRFGNARELGDALASALAGMPHSLGPVTNTLAFARTAQLGSTTSANVTDTATRSPGRRWVIVGAMAALGATAGVAAFAVSGRGSTPVIASPTAELVSPKSAAVSAIPVESTPTPPSTNAAPTTLPPPAAKKGAASAATKPTPSTSASVPVASAAPKLVPTKVDHEPEIY